MRELTPVLWLCVLFLLTLDVALLLLQVLQRSNAA